MREAVFVSYARTGLAKAARGGFNATPAMTMAAHAIRSAVEKSGVEPDAVEDVALGNGAHGAGNLGRLASLLAGLPVRKPAARRCCQKPRCSPPGAANGLAPAPITPSRLPPTVIAAQLLPRACSVPTGPSSPGRDL